ncbi:YtzC family protein [Bacillus vallismortis]|uniref:YtzC family protein n=1 Tax=Bacillus vallismortis TaxID=72361 RepID=UPI0020912D1C|nr:YtzC family protein [Bacillus vallismortis]MCO4849606.1 YtzC family protein [Bacillus vallismortis]
MATRQSVDEHLQQCMQVYDYAEEQIKIASKQEHDNDQEYSEAQMQLENAVNALNKLWLSSNDQQREQLYRMRLQLQTLQNHMILQHPLDV